jgi:type IV pilus assembly protein PilC
LKPRVSSKMHPKVEGADILAFFQQLSTLFRAGTPIHDALLIASTQSQSTELQKIIVDVARKVASGNSLFGSLGKYPDHFKQEWIEVIKSGESSGLLGEVLMRLQTQIDKANQLQAKLVSSMMYPAICLVVAVGAVAVMLVKVVPTFATMFVAMEMELPAITQYVMAASEFLQNKGHYILGGLIFGWISLKRYISTPEGRKAKDRFLVSIPLIGEVTVQACMQKYANNISVLLTAGLPLLDAIHSMKGIYKSNSVYEDAMESVARYVSQGGALADGVERTKVFTSFAVSMTRIGEQSGTLPACLDEVEVYYRRKIEVLVERLTSTMETGVILFMGVAVAVILTSVYLPMFSMAGGVG